MAKVELKGTTFAFSVLPFNSEFAKTKIVVENEFISYQNESENFLRGDIENSEKEILSKNQKREDIVYV